MYTSYTIFIQISFICVLFRDHLFSWPHIFLSTQMNCVARNNIHLLACESVDILTRTYHSPTWKNSMSVPKACQWSKKGKINDIMEKCVKEKTYDMVCERKIQGWHVLKREKKLIARKRLGRDDWNFERSLRFFFQYIKQQQILFHEEALSAFSKLSEVLQLQNN